METIDLSKYVRTGEGANGASYDSLENPEMMVKLYNVEYPVDTVFSELEAARKVYDLGIPSPKPGEIVTDGQRLGIRFRKVIGKRSYSRAFADEPERIEEFSREFARECRRLHSVECPDGMFGTAKPQFLHLLDADKCFNLSEKQVIADFIESVPESKTALHGDMHFGNVLTTLPSGAPLSYPHEVLFIDLGYFATGYFLFDFGMMQNICLTADEEFRYENFHIHGDRTARIWEYFVDEYFDGRKSVSEVNELVFPFQAIKLFLVEYNAGIMFPKYEAIIRKAFHL